MRTWNFYTAKELSPQGWVRRQLEIQAEGLSGNLDKVWRDVRDSAWIGGDAEGWERVPYWLDGFIPLAYLLDNKDMIARAQTYVDAILAQQKPSGWICPCDQDKIPGYDSWAVQLISKVLVVYYECSGDERIPEALYRVLKNYYDLLKTILKAYGTAPTMIGAVPFLLELDTSREPHYIRMNVRRISSKLKCWRDND